MDWRWTIVVIGVMLAGPAGADEAVTRQDADACQVDIHRLCEAFYPDEQRVGQCLVDRRTELSPDCARALARPR